MRSRLYKTGSNQYILRPKATVQAILLSFPFAFSSYFLLLFFTFFLKSFRTLKYPAVWLVFLVSTFIPVSLAQAPRSVLTHPFIPKAIPAPLTHKQLIYTYPHGDIIERIWNNESSEGKATDPTGINVKCAAKGESNEFGFDPQDNYCFTSFRESVQRVNGWFNSCLSKNTLAQCLEIYSGNSKAYIASFLNQ